MLHGLTPLSKSTEGNIMKVRMIFEPIFDVNVDAEFAWAKFIARPNGRTAYEPCMRASRAHCSCGNRYGFCHLFA
jgi:hypothetical protein